MHIAQWISHYSDKIKPLVINRVFLLKDQALSSFVNLKSELADVILGVINEKDPLTVDTDASDVAISATLNQNNRPVAFWSRSLRRNKLTQSSVEKKREQLSKLYVNGAICSQENPSSWS